jgi:hypothetical protein
MIVTLKNTAELQNLNFARNCTDQEGQILTLFDGGKATDLSRGLSNHQRDHRN